MCRQGKEAGMTTCQSVQSVRWLCCQPHTPHLNSHRATQALLKLLYHAVSTSNLYTACSSSTTTITPPQLADSLFVSAASLTEMSAAAGPALPALLPALPGSESLRPGP